MNKVPNYCRSGHDGALPPIPAEWQRGLVYTARPHIPSPVVSGREYRITVAFKQRIAPEEEFTNYAKLYRRVTRLANLRIAQLTYAGEADTLHTWIARQGWGSIGEPYSFATAFLTVGLVSLKSSDAKPQGEPPPTPELLMAPGGVVLQQPESGDRSWHADEIYNEFDLREHPNSEANRVMLSYGERVPDYKDLNFEPFVNKAEKFAEWYDELLKSESVTENEQPFKILGREWYSVTSPDLAVVHIYFVC